MAPPASDATQQRSSRFTIRKLFSCQKRLTPKVLEDAEKQTPTTEGSLSAPDHQQFRAGPEYATTVSESREQTLSTGASRPGAVATKELSSRRPANARNGARLLFRRKQADALKDAKVEPRKTAMVRKKEFPPSIGTHSSGLSLGKMIRSGISDDTKRLLKDAFEDFWEFKREQERNRIREEEKQEEIARVEEVMDVVETKVVRKGSTIRHVKVMRPAVRLEKGVSLDPNQRLASMNITDGRNRAGVSSCSSIAGSQAAETGPSSTTPVISGSIMDRGPGFKRRRLSNHFGVQPCKPSEKKCDSFDGPSNSIRLDFALLMCDGNLVIAGWNTSHLPSLNMVLIIHFEHFVQLSKETVISGDVDWCA
ncbi:uncharacterized protein CC84DRAFT_1235008 [Paraphaeosphaeria sporulosa]|uniref:Uncharacterized protein n=1 Tax=Paraphaeosphaeria sporulosa TaxID=1460663 RepID=A0A177CPP8_9PLEO|nr:uncharacterized protein CC84DRAFT_1235008 [Paraphaeosphaeria sporulosa]OAG09493.1 hypothetical protein CC84DRAFT_1235008 [Paraphaeosphaeria sporulosa]